MQFDGTKLRALRDDRAERSGKKKTQLDLEICAQTGISHRTYVKWMNNKSIPNGEDLMKLARACEVEPDFFFVAQRADPFTPAA
jgi:transcriptional regulator with XRE-family HTH domain